MDQNEPPKLHLFQSEATEILEALKRALSNLLAGLGIRRPGELQRLLQLDTTLAYQVFRVIDESQALAAGPSVPSRVSIERFLTSAAKAGASKELLNNLRTVYDHFELLIEKHAGDRTSFNSLINGVTGASDQRVHADLQHRRNIFRGMSHIVGVQAQARFGAFFLTPVDVRPINTAILMGYVGLRLLRPIDRVRVHGVYIHEEQIDDPGVSKRQPLDLAGNGNGYLLTDYSSKPLPVIDTEVGGQDGDRWVETSLLKPQIGNLGVSTVLFGEKCRAGTSWTTLTLASSVPCEALIIDFLIQPGTLKSAPQLELLLGPMQAPNRQPDGLPLHGKDSISFLGRGPDVFALPELPGYPRLAREVARELGCEIDSFEVWRARLEFPVYPGRVQIVMDRCDTDPAP